MDIGHAYGTPAGQRVMLYAEPSLAVPEVIALVEQGGRVITFSRLAPESLYCADVPGIKGSCTNPDCHRLPLGVCGCGRHKGRQSFVRAVRS
jgi:hypothetical protein